ncbi:MAG TPA: ester cyclase [Sporichthya sp.]|nr:ester cyclase [Sporichthya sp.]
MSENVAAVEQALECLNKGDLDGYMALYSDDAQFVGYPADVQPNVAGVRAFYAELLSGIPDLDVEAIDIFAAGARVVVRYSITGNHQGDLMGVPRTGHAIAVEGLTILYFADGKVAHRVNRADDVALLTQLGIIPTPSSTAG